MLTLVVSAWGLVIFSDNSHFNILSPKPKTLAPVYKTSMDLETLSKLSLGGGLKVSGFSNIFSKPCSVLFILKTWSW